MIKNTGVLDRGLRVLAGLGAIELAYSGLIGTWGYFGIIPMLTGAIGLCPAYAIIGVNTCPVKR